jgi:PD-(D/E)XK nuclease superfamily
VADGSDSGDAEPEVGHVHRLKMLGAMLESVETVLWWDFQAPPLAPQPPWANREAEQPKEQGVKLQSIASRVARDNLMALRTILAARKQLVFLIPRRTGNEPSVHHPLFDRIQSVVNDKLGVLDLDRYLTDPVLVRTPVSVEPIVSLARRPLPGIQRWWKLGDRRHLGPRDLESFTSAQKYIFSPYDWVLNYKAKLRPGVLFRNKIANTSRQNGNLLHRLTELLFAPDASVRWVSSSLAEIERWVHAEWAKLLPAEAANLLLPGNRAAADRVLENASRAIWALIVQLRAASIVKTTVNLCPPTARFIGGALHGFIDLLVENSGGSSGVVDMKYSGLNQRKEELANNRQLQLAVYGYLVAQSGTWPDSAFFILTSRALLAQTRRFFPEADLVAPRSALAGLETCWQEFEMVWNWRRALLDRGWIELTVGGAKASDGSGPESDASPPIPGWQASEDEDPFNQFDVLTGWAENA